jgi:hypothetical protein
MTRLLSAAVALALAAPLAAADPIKVLIVDGQNNHNWRATTPILKKILEDAKIFTVDVATAPERPRPPQKPKDGADQQAVKAYEAALLRFKQESADINDAVRRFRPKFKDYHVVVSNYNGEPWAKETRSDFVEYVAHGGGFVCVHAADNAFPDWPEYNAMIGVGGWGGRSEKSGPYVRLRDGKFVLDTSKGNGGSHGDQHAFVVTIRDRNHPITAAPPDRPGHRIRGQGEARQRRGGADAHGDRLRKGPGLPHHARARRGGNEVRRLPDHVRPRDGVGGHREGNGAGAERLSGARQGVGPALSRFGMDSGEPGGV